MEYPLIFQNLIDSLKKLPGVGSKSAERMAYDILNMDEETIKKFADAILAINNISRCPICGNLSENNEPCEICKSDERIKNVICVVEDVRDVIAMERTHEFKGVYHVLHGSISPMNGIGPDDIKIKELLARLADGSVKEIILATTMLRIIESTPIIARRTLYLSITIR